MDLAATIMNKLPVYSISNDSKSYILIQTKWGDHGFECSVHDATSNKTYKGKLSKNDMQEAATELEISYEEFFSDCRKALTSHGGLPDFRYEFDHTAKRLLLIKCADFTMQYLELKLNEDSRSVGEMLEAAIEIINTQKDANLEKDEISEKWQQNYRETVDAFERCLEEKNKLENKLLKKFALLLNSKKIKIAELQQRLADNEGNLDHKNDTDSDEPSTSAATHKKNNVKRGKVLISSDDEDFMVSTQPMTQPATNVMAKRNRTKLGEDTNDITMYSQKPIDSHDESD